jgi:hypothetical protein
MIDVSVVIVSFNVSQLLRECIESLQDALQIGESQIKPSGGLHVNSEIIVIDSGSSDDTLRMLAQHFDRVRVVTAGTNVGFSKGNNIGIEHSQGRYILLLNPDTRVLDRAIQSLIAYIDQHPRVGMVGPQLLNNDGTIQSSRRRFPTLWTGLFESTWLEPLAPRGLIEQYYMLDTNAEEVTPVGWLTGAAMLVRRSVVDEVGGLDESFFMYSEELDWQKRISEAGWEIVYVPSAKIIHYGGKSSEQVIAQRHLYFQNSKIHYFRKFHGAAAAFTLRYYLLLSYTIQIVIEAGKSLVNHKREMRLERIKTYWHVIRSGLKGT